MLPPSNPNPQTSALNPYLYLRLIIAYGCIWRFPYTVLAYGGIFLIPYTISVLLIAIPQIYLEASLGIFFQGSSVIKQYLRINKKFTGVGVTSMVGLTCVLVNCLILLTYCLTYLFVVYRDNKFFPAGINGSAEIMMHTKDYFYQEVLGIGPVVNGKIFWELACFFFGLN